MSNTRDLLVLVEKFKKKNLRKIVGCIKKLSYCDSYVRKYSYMYILTFKCMQILLLWLNYKVEGQ